jgi:hypothetical protein
VLRLRPIALLALADCGFAVVAATLVIRPLTPLPAWTDYFVLIGLALGLATLGLYVLTRRRIAPRERPLAAVLTDLCWIAMFVAGLGRFGSPPPWWFGESPAHWLASAYAFGVPQAIGLAIVCVGLLDAGAPLRQRHASRT